MKTNLLTISIFDGKNLIISIAVIVLFIIFVLVLFKKGILTSAYQKELQRLKEEERLEKEELARQAKEFEDRLL